MSVRKIRNSWWVDFHFDGTRHRKRSPENSRAGARSYEFVLRQRLARGQGIDRDATPENHLTFREVADQWLSTYVATNTKPSVQLGYRRILERHLLPRFGERPLRSLTTLDLERFKADQLKNNLCASTVNKHLIVLSGVFKAARDFGWADSSPRIAWLKVPPERFDFLSPEEAQQLLEANRGARWHDMILCALHTGMRAGELLALKWQAVNTASRVLTVSCSIAVGVEGSPKNNRIRHIPLTEELRSVLLTRQRHGAYVFGLPDGRPSKLSMAVNGLHKAARRARLRRLGWHMLRHTFASRLATKGAPIPAIQSLLGHGTIQMTMRYAHLAPSTLASVVRMLDSDRQPVVNGDQNSSRTTAYAQL